MLDGFHGFRLTFWFDFVDFVKIVRNLVQDFGRMITPRGVNIERSDY